MGAGALVPTGAAFAWGSLGTLVLAPVVGATGVLGIALSAALVGLPVFGLKRDVWPLVGASGLVTNGAGCTLAVRRSSGLTSLLVASSPTSSRVSSSPRTNLRRATLTFSVGEVDTGGGLLPLADSSAGNKFCCPGCGGGGGAGRSSGGSPSISRI